MPRPVLPLAALAACLLITPVFAQPAAGRGQGMGGMVSRAMLARQESVQTELALTADQKASIESELSAGGPGGAGGTNPRDMSEEERQKWRDERVARTAADDKKLAGILDAKQAARLEQIRVQALGGGILMDPEVSKALGITEAQTEQFREAMQALRDEAQNGGGGGGGMREQMTAKAMAILTPEQKTKLDSLRGPAFDVSTLQMRGRRRAAN